MSWESITRDELSIEMGAALDTADDEVRAAWERLRIEPEKWRCSPEGDEGGGFWAVGIDGETEPWSSVYLSHAVGCGQSLVDALTAYVDTASSGWRQLHHYLAEGGPTLQVLAAGSGKLLAAPRSIAHAAREIAEKHGARASALDDRAERRDAYALVLGSSFIVARAFRLEG